MGSLLRIVDIFFNYKDLNRKFYIKIEQSIDCLIYASFICDNSDKSDQLFYLAYVRLLDHIND